MQWVNFHFHIFFSKFVWKSWSLTNVFVFWVEVNEMELQRKWSTSKLVFWPPEYFSWALSKAAKIFKVHLKDELPQWKCPWAKVKSPGRPAPPAYNWQSSSIQSNWIRFNPTQSNLAQLMGGVKLGQIILCRLLLISQFTPPPQIFRVSLPFSPSLSFSLIFSNGDWQ